MINRKIAVSTLSIVTALSLMTGATFAYFSDTATSTANTFGAATMDLQLSNDGIAFLNDVTATFAVSNLMPGVIRAQTVSVRNSGTTDIAEIEMGLTATAVDTGSNGSDLRNVLNISVFENSSANGSNTGCAGGTNVTPAIDLAVGNNDGTLTVAEFNGDTYDALALPIAVGGANKTACIEVSMASTAGDIYQGDTANATFTFTANQNTSQ